MDYPQKHPDKFSALKHRSVIDLTPQEQQHCRRSQNPRNLMNVDRLLRTASSFKEKSEQYLYPVIEIPYPQQEIIIEKVNSKPASQNEDFIHMMNQSLENSVNKSITIKVSPKLPSIMASMINSIPQILPPSQKLKRKEL